MAIVSDVALSVLPLVSVPNDSVSRRPSLITPELGLLITAAVRTSSNVPMLVVSAAEDAVIESTATKASPASSVSVVTAAGVVPSGTLTASV